MRSQRSCSLLTSILITVIVMLAALPITASQASADPSDTSTNASDWIYDPTNILGIELEVPPENIAKLNVEPKKYVDSTITISRGQTKYGPFNVGVRLKGSASFRPLSGKSALLVKFAHKVKGQKFFGLKNFTLNNMVQDHSKVAESVSYRIARDFGIPASRTGYASVTLNGVNYGTYLNLEKLDDVWSARHFNGLTHLFEAGRDTDVTPKLVTKYEIDEGSEDDLSDLNALVQAANSSRESWWSKVSATTDIQKMTKMWAFEHYVLHWDGYSVTNDSATPNNHYLHSDADGKFVMIPSGLDQTIGPMDIRTNRSQGTESFGRVGQGVLFKRCIEDPLCKSMYETSLNDLYMIVKNNNYADQLTEIASAISSNVMADPRTESSSAQILAAQEFKKNKLSQRTEDLAKWLASPNYYVDSGPDVSPPTAKPTPAKFKPVVTLKRLTKLKGPIGRKTVKFRATTRLESTKVVFYRSNSTRTKASRVATRTSGKLHQATQRFRLIHNKLKKQTILICAASGGYVTGAIRVTYRPSKGYRVAGNSKAPRKLKVGEKVRCLR